MISRLGTRSIANSEKTVFPMIRLPKDSDAAELSLTIRYRHILSVNKGKDTALKNLNSLYSYLH